MLAPLTASRSGEKPATVSRFTTFQIIDSETFIELSLKLRAVSKLSQYIKSNKHTTLTVRLSWNIMELSVKLSMSINNATAIETKLTDSQSVDCL